MHYYGPVDLFHNKYQAQSPIGFLNINFEYNKSNSEVLKN